MSADKGELLQSLRIERSEIGMAVDKGELLQSLRIERSEIGIAADKGDLLHSLRIERSDALPKPAPRRRLPVWIAAAVALAAVVGPLGLFAFPSSVPFSVHLPFSVRLPSSIDVPSWVHLPSSIHLPFSSERQEARDSATPLPPPPPPPVAVAPPPPPALVASGYVVARRTATVAAEVTAKVVDVPITEGMVVKKGDVLAQLDSVLPERDLALARTRADAAEAAIAATAANLADAERIMNRNLRLQVGVSVTEADLTASEAKAGMLRAQLKQNQAQFETAKQDVKHAAEVVDQYTIHAPFGGVVVARDAQPGEMISPLSVGGFTRTGICTLVDMNSIEVDVDVNESFIGRVHPGMPVSVVLDAYPDWTMPGSVIDIVPQANRDKGTVKVRIRIDKKDPRILPDMSAKVSFQDTRTASGTSAEKFVAGN
jgi:RND family efflux transporter MFP subunit